MSYEIMKRVTKYENYVYYQREFFAFFVNIFRNYNSTSYFLFCYIKIAENIYEKHKCISNIQSG